MSDPFPADALEENRAGRLTDPQKRALRSQSGGYRKSELQFAGLLTVLGLLIWLAPGPSRYATTKPLIGIACLIGAGFLVVRSFIGADSQTRDMRSGTVASVEGAISKWSVSSRGSASSSYLISVAGVRVHTWRGAYDAAPEAGIVKIYYLPNSHRLVNLEHLPDRPLPADALRDPKHAMRDIAQSIRSGGSIQAAEARAELAAMGNQLRQGLAATQQGSAPRDPRPLAQSIVGTWSNALITLAFSGDGSVVATMPGGHTRQGHWSVDASGRLVSDATGANDAAEAWVAGDELTISADGGMLTFQRAT